MEIYCLKNRVSIETITVTKMCIDPRIRNGRKKDSTCIVTEISTCYFVCNKGFLKDGKREGEYHCYSRENNVIVCLRDQTKLIVKDNKETEEKEKKVDKEDNTTDSFVFPTIASLCVLVVLIILGVIQLCLYKRNRNGMCFCLNYVDNSQPESIPMNTREENFFLY